MRMTMRKAIAVWLLCMLIAGPVMGQTAAEQERMRIRPMFISEGVELTAVTAPVPAVHPRQAPVARSLISNDPFLSLEAQIVQSIMVSDLTGELKLAALREYLSTVKSINADSLTRQSQRGTNWREILLAVITGGLAIYGAAK